VARLVTCEHDARRVTRTEHDGTITVLIEKFDGKPLNSANGRRNAEQVRRRRTLNRKNGAITFVFATWHPNAPQTPKSLKRQSQNYGAKDMVHK
jgi:hypothetical protein